MTAYPNPCDNCAGCRWALGCSDWQMRYRYRQKQINAYARKLIRPVVVVRKDVFLYEHPDILRRFLAEGPCQQCGMKDLCDTPCAAYWTWWDMRMERYRKGMGA